MRCEVVAIGTELLLGIIVDSNSAWIGEQLALAGIDSYFQVKVGDNFGRIEGCIRQALERSDAVICCGGLGPTQDDITRDVIAKVMGVEMRRDQAIADKIKRMFEIRGRVMSANNLRQADIPVGAEPIAQMPGTAPGLLCPIGGNKVIYAVPGVPREMKEMFTGTILPDLRRRAGQSAVIRSRVLRSWGLSESGIDEMLTERMAELDKRGNPTIAFQASGIEGIKVRLVAKCDDEATAKRLLDEEELLIRGILGDAIFGIDEESMELVVLNLLRKRGLTVAAMETLTGGLLASRMSALDPTMTTFLGATVRADDISPESLLLPPEQRASATADQARVLHRSSVGLSAVGPRPDEDQPPGTVYCGVVTANAQHVDRVVLPANRLREYVVINLLNFARRTLA
jgi:nicotinamide-nucleotide amidase